jgi:hypothetical protein
LLRTPFGDFCDFYDPSFHSSAARLLIPAGMITLPSKTVNLLKVGAI